MLHPAAKDSFAKTTLAHQWSDYHHARFRERRRRDRLILLECFLVALVWFAFLGFF